MKPKLQMEESISLLSMENGSAGKPQRMLDYGAVGPPSVTDKDCSKPTSLYSAKTGGLIDLVLAWREVATEGHDAYRKLFQARLEKDGLILETEPIEESQDGEVGFVKVHGPWGTLARAAEVARLKLPFQEAPSDGIGTAGCCSVFGRLPRKLRPPNTPFYYTMEFSRSNLTRYLTQDAATFFSQSTRIRLVWDIVQRASVSYDEVVAAGAMPLADHEEGTSVGLSMLMKNSVYEDAFPLHDGEERSKDTPSLWPLRPWLRETWARAGRCFTRQPIHQIRAYFGEKVGLYFAWLGFYTAMLVPLSLVGLVVFAFGLATFEDDPAVRDVCHGNISREYICRSCHYSLCHFTLLSTSCTAASTNAVFSNWATLVMAALSAVWGVFFLELWKRRQAKLACQWDVFDLYAEYEPPRPEYQAAAGSRRRNPVTGEEEAFVPTRSLLASLALSAASVTFMIALVLALIAGVIVYKVAMVIVLYQMQSPIIHKLGSTTVASSSAALINSVCIMTMEKIYTNIAWKLTEKELPRSESDFETSYTYKMFIFQFINNFATLFYLAFVQGKLAGSPRDDGILTDHCPPTGCLFSVTTQLFVILTVKQIVNNAAEVGLPWLKGYVRRRRSQNAAKSGNSYTRWERDWDLEPLPKLPLFAEYFEMVMQMGFVLLFVAAFPLAPLFALLNNVVEIRVDAAKFTTASRRAVPHRARDIGSWFGLLEVIVKLAVLTNALLIAFTTDLIDRLLYMFAYSPDGSLEGFMDWRLSVFATDDWGEPELQLLNDGTNLTHCRYRGFFYPPGDVPGHPKPSEAEACGLTEVWWRSMLAKVTFVLVFEHAVFAFQGLLQYLNPDVPEEVSLHVQRNRYAAKVSAKAEEESRQRRRVDRQGLQEDQKLRPPTPAESSHVKDPKRSPIKLPKFPLRKKK